MSANATEEHGWTAVSRSLGQLVASRKTKTESKTVSLEDIPIPDTSLVQRVAKYAKDNLSSQTFNHSMRVYYYGP